jgi:hypothetical protein
LVQGFGEQAAMKTSITEHEFSKLLLFRARFQTMMADIDNLECQTGMVLDDYPLAIDWLRSNGQTLASWLSSRGIERGF